MKCFLQRDVFSSIFFVTLGGFFAVASFATGDIFYEKTFVGFIFSAVIIITLNFLVLYILWRRIEEKVISIKDLKIPLLFFGFLLPFLSILIGITTINVYLKVFALISLFISNGFFFYGMNYFRKKAELIM